MTNNEEASLKEYWEAFAKKYAITTVSTYSLVVGERDVIRIEVDGSFRNTFDNEEQIREKFSDYGLELIEIYDSQGVIDKFLVGQLTG